MSTFLCHNRRSRNNIQGVHLYKFNEWSLFEPDSCNRSIPEDSDFLCDTHAVSTDIIKNIPRSKVQRYHSSPAIFDFQKHDITMNSPDPYKVQCHARVKENESKSVSLSGVVKSVNKAYLFPKSQTHTL